MAMANRNRFAALAEEDLPVPGWVPAGEAPVAPPAAAGAGGPCVPGGLSAAEYIRKGQAYLQQSMSHSATLDANIEAAQRAVEAFAAACSKVDASQQPLAIASSAHTAEARMRISSLLIKKKQFDQAFEPFDRAVTMIELALVRADGVLAADVGTGRALESVLGVSIGLLRDQAMKQMGELRRLRDRLEAELAEVRESREPVRAKLGEARWKAGDTHSTFAERHTRLLAEHRGITALLGQMEDRAVAAPRVFPGFAVTDDEGGGNGAGAVDSRRR